MLIWVKRYLPSALTLGNLYLGLVSIALLFMGNPRGASYLIIAGMFFDGLDGRLARKLNVTSNFGKELDSLADVITFGLAPAALLLFLDTSSVLHYVAAGVFASCGAVRLARFNTQGSSASVHFVGLPITAGGGIAATTLLYIDVLPLFVFPVVYILLAALMVSTLPYPSLKAVRLPRNVYVLGVYFLGTVAFMWFAREWAFVPLLLYAFFGLRLRSGLWRRLPYAWRVRYETGKELRRQRRLNRHNRRKEK